MSQACEWCLTVVDYELMEIDVPESSTSGGKFCSWACAAGYCVQQAGEHIDYLKKKILEGKQDDVPLRHYGFKASPPKDPGAVAMAMKRAASLTPERRKEIAQNAIAARWEKKKGAAKAAKKAKK